MSGNPLKYSDPKGLSPFPWDYLDFGFFAQSLYEYNQCSSNDNAFNLSLDAIGLLPGIPALGALRRIDRAVDAVKKPPIIIGENMKDRILPAAKKRGAHYYKPRKTKGDLIKKNEKWIDNRMKEGREIIDIGPDPRRSKRSLFYEAEKRRIERKNYPVIK